MNRPFYPDFMVRRWTKPPRYICSTKLDQLLGRVSPSLLGFVPHTDEQWVEIWEWRLRIAKWNIYKRRASREEWQLVWRNYREAGNDQKTCG